jgi:hypothetical protein
MAEPKDPQAKSPKQAEPAKPLTPAAAKAALTEAQSTLEKHVARLKKQFAYNLKLAQDRQAFAIKELATIEAVQKKLAMFRSHLTGSHHFNNMALLVRVYEAVKDLMDFEVMAYTHNLALLDAENLEELPAFKVPTEDAEYLEARC